MQTGDAKGALALLEKSSFRSSPEVQKALAQTLLELHRGDEALAILNPLAEQAPTDGNIHTWLGMALYQTRDYSRAGKVLSEALRFKSDNPVSLYYQGLVLLKQNRPGEAQHFFKELCDRRSTQWQGKGWVGRGMAFSQDGKSEAAIEAFSKSQRVHPTAEAAAYLALESLKSKDEKGAEKWSRESRRLDPSHPLGLMAQIDLLLSQEKKDEALSVTNQALKTHSESCEHLIVAAKAQYNSGHNEKTGELSRKANDLCPTEASPHFYLGSVAAQTGDKEGAKRHFRQYRSMGGNPKSVPKGYR
jgi:Flp pilus assembly protein TadD